jgi:hypothetical protein
MLMADRGKPPNIPMSMVKMSSGMCFQCPATIARRMTLGPWTLLTCAMSVAFALD